MQRGRRYEELVGLKSPTDEERAEKAEILAEMKRVSGDLAREAREAFEEIEDRRKRT